MLVRKVRSCAGGAEHGTALVVRHSVAVVKSGTFQNCCRQSLRFAITSGTKGQTTKAKKEHKEDEVDRVATRRPTVAKARDKRRAARYNATSVVG